MLSELRQLVNNASAIVGFTGAGLSTECGVPDFRSPGSPWLANKPVDFSDFLRDPDLRALGWRRKFAMDDLYAGVQPGRGHRVLARLVASGRMQGIITQNIDGLHQASGVPAAKLAELHGNGTYATCLDCGMRHELRDVRADFEARGRAPVCECGGLVKSATISFGQAMPVAAMRQAEALARNCDLFLVLGSSLLVRPAAGFPVLAKQNGAKLVILNREPTPLDDLADLVVHGEIGAMLAPFAAN